MSYSYTTRAVHNKHDFLGGMTLVAVLKCSVLLRALFGRHAVCCLPLCLANTCAPCPCVSPSSDLELDRVLGKGGFGEF
jgi:hypothetical protein